MRLSLLMLALLFLACAAPPTLYAQESIPRFTSVEPLNGKVGDVITVTGENISKTVVAETYLTDGKNDFKVVMTDQDEKSIKFAIPKTVKPGRYRLMVLTKGKEPKLIEQPVRLEVEE